MKRMLILLLLLLAGGCDGPVFRRAADPSERGLRVALQAALPTYLTPHKLQFRSGNSSGEVRYLQFELEVSPTTALFSSEGVTPPGQEAFLLRRSHEAGTRLKLYGSVVASASESDWRFGNLEWKDDQVTRLGRPRDAWPGSYVLEGSPEAEAVLRVKAKARDEQAEQARRHREAELEQEAKFEADKLKRRAEEARIAQLELDNQAKKQAIDAEQLRLKSVERDEEAKRLLVAAQRRIEEDEQKKKELDVVRQRRTSEFMGAFSPNTGFSGTITNMKTGMAYGFRMNCISTNGYSIVWETVGENKRIRRFTGTVKWDKERDLLYLSSFPDEPNPHNPDEKSGWLTQPGKINLALSADGTVEGNGDFTGLRLDDRILYSLKLKRE